MIRELEQSEGPILAFEISGKVTLEEEKEWIAKFDERIKQHEKISVLVILGEDTSWGTIAGYEDIKWLIQHFKKFDRIAIVTDSTIWKWLIAVDRQFAKLVGINERHFEPTEAKEAWNWLSENTATA